MPGSEALQRDAELLFEVVREAGQLALTLLRQQVRRWSKSDGTPVTEADIRVDALLRSKLQARRPAYGWLSEETPDDRQRLACDRMWIADPIDGTRDFIAGGTNWCIAVALIAEGRPTAAAIYRPATEDFYWAIEGKGAHRNGETLATSAGRSLAGARVVGSRNSLALLAAHGIEPVASGSLPLQLRLAQVASGEVDAAVSVGHKNDWDLAAGDLLVAEAGGCAVDVAGKPYIYNREATWQQGMIATGQARRVALTEALRKP
ncbi:MAG: 3'(2'),5'-bisphosphate nucleotidase CysQ [Rhizobiales bacterium]|nr:3'(2'),5'-bisphosphate nucleotidase CysQ [Hyphomicrobiales bacterium]